MSNHKKVMGRTRICTDRRTDRVIPINMKNNSYSSVSKNVRHAEFTYAYNLPIHDIIVFFQNLLYQRGTTVISNSFYKPTTPGKKPHAPPKCLTMNHPARGKLLSHTGNIVVAQDGCIKGINSFPRKLCCMSLYSQKVHGYSIVQ